MKTYKSILEPVKFQYKGALERAAQIRADAEKNPRIQALKVALERGKELIK